ncbi:MAG: transposase [Dehalococcoidia bacterium]
MLERAYREGEALGVPVWCEDEAGPYQAIPQPGASWEPEGQPAQQPHAYVRGGTAKLLTLFRPATGEVRGQGVTRSPNAILHPWLEAELPAILAALPASEATLSAEAIRAVWESWQEGLSVRLTLPAVLPPLRMVLIWDNLRGQYSASLVLWLFEHGILPLYTPWAGSWLNMAASVQRIVVRRALAGQHPQSAAEVITWLEATVRSWNAAPTPFVWGGASGWRGGCGHGRGGTRLAARAPHPPALAAAAPPHHHRE